MGAHSNGRRTLAGFLGVAFGIVLLFGAVALLALRPTDSLAWVQIPALTADLRLDAGLQTKPLKSTVIGEVLNDRGLEGSGEAVALPPALTIVGPQPPIALSLPPTARPTVSPSPTAQPTPSPAPTPTPTPTPSPSPSPSPTPAPTPTPTPTPTPRPTPTPAPFAIVSARETVQPVPNKPKDACSNVTITATGAFTTNRTGGSVAYEWLRTDDTGKRTIITEPGITIQPGDTRQHSVVTDQWTPTEPGTEQLVFLTPSAPTVPAQGWSCVG